MMTRVSTSLCYILFAFLLPSAASEACAASETCQSLTQAVETEDGGHGLELLQVRGARVSGRICPVPDIQSEKTKYSKIGKGCPAHNCLEGNRDYDTFSDAWEKCGLTQECDFVMKYSDGKFYLRRASDPDNEDIERAKVFTYDCQEARDEQKLIDEGADRLAKKLVKKMRTDKDKELQKSMKHHHKKLKVEYDNGLIAEEKEVKKEEAEVKKVTKKAAALSKAADEAPAKMKKEREEVSKLRSKLESTNEAEAKAEKFTEQDAKLKEEDKEVEAEIEKEASEVSELSEKYEALADEAEEEMKETSAMKKQIKQIEKKEQKRFDKLKAKDSKAQQTISEEKQKLQDIKKSKVKAHKKLTATHEKQKATKAQTEKDKANLDRAKKGHFEPWMLDFDTEKQE